MSRRNARKPRRNPAAEAKEMMPWNGLVASAMVLDGENTQNLVINPLEWQREAWAFYHTLGELRFALGTWLANCMSRVRLVAAVKRVGEDSPSPVTEGPVADLVASLAGGIGGQAAMLKRQSVQLSVCGDSYLVGEDPNGLGNLEQMTWKVYSSDEIRIKSRSSRTRVPTFGAHELEVSYEIMTQRNDWRDLAPESLVVRCWDPDEQFAWAATSVCQAALPILREVDFYNRYIIAVLTSRLALNGLLLIPSEVTFPAKPQYKDQSDPFVAELIDVATRSIKNPGSASGAIPMPIKVPSQYIEHFKHLTFDTPMGKEVMDNRTRALERLATALNVPAEVLTGVAQMNHWGQWQLEESGIKIYISPGVEVLVNCYTQGFLYPLMDSMGLDREAPDGGTYLVWYDASELAQQPDRSSEAQALSDRGIISDEATRRESGFEEADAPTTDELKELVLRRIALGAGADALTALAKLTGDESLMPPEPVPAPEAPGSGTPTENAPGGSESPASGQSPSDAVKTPPATKPAQLLGLTERLTPVG